MKDIAPLHLLAAAIALLPTSLDIWHGTQAQIDNIHW